MRRIFAPLRFLWEKFRSLSRKKKVFVIIALIVFASFISSTFGGNGEEYAVEKVKKDSITEYVTETGTIIDEGSIKVYSPSTGIVQELYVTNGDVVEEGADLFKIKSTATEQEKQEASAANLKGQSDLAAAQANANSLRASMYTAWEDFRDLATNSNYQDGSGNPKNQQREATEFQTSQDSWLAAEKLYKNSQTQIAAAQAAATAANLAYQATQNATVKAQTTGVVQNLSVRTGGKTQANVQSLSATTATPALLITTGSSRVKVNIGQSDISKVKPGQKVKLDPDAFQNTEFEGVVENVDEIGSDASGVVEYSVYIYIDGNLKDLKTGMTVDADIETDKAENTLTVSNSAVVLYKGGRAVRVKGQNGEIEYIPVQVGIRGNERTQILKGLSEGQEVISSLSNDQLQRPGLFGN